MLCFSLPLKKRVRHAWGASPAGAGAGCAAAGACPPCGAPGVTARGACVFAALPEKGSKAILRARLMATPNPRWCRAQTPVIRRGRILPRSCTNCDRMSARLVDEVHLLDTEL